MEWTRSHTLALAPNSCAFCRGLGLQIGRRGDNACSCVLRAIFRACYARFRYCITKEKYMSRVSPEYSPGKDRTIAWGRKDEEYIADFCLVSRRALEEDEHKIFRFHFLLGADWKLCCRTMKMDRGNFFHAVYRIEQKLGKVFRELKPYPLYPLDEYFNGNIRRLPPRPVLVDSLQPAGARGRKAAAPLRPPLRAAA